MEKTAKQLTLDVLDKSPIQQEYIDGSSRMSFKEHPT